MGTYATTTALDTMIPGVNIGTTTASSLAGLCITWAENQVNAKLSRRYDTSSWNTSTAVPPQVRSITEMIAGGHFFKQISRGGPESLERGNELMQDGLDQLMMLAKSECDLLDTAGSFTPERTDSSRVHVVSSTSAYHTTFDEDDPLNWTPDSDKLSDISSGRL